MIIEARNQSLNNKMILKKIKKKKRLNLDEMTDQNVSLQMPHIP